MKNITLAGLIVFMTAVFIFVPHIKNANRNSGITTAHAEEGFNKSRKITIYYFHGDFRCKTCLKLEKMSRKAVVEGFKDYIASGTISFKAVNVDRPENEHYVNEFNSGRGLVVAETLNGKKVKWKNLERVWELTDDEKEFIRYVQEGVKGFLSIK
jgi:hypothetical protein